MHMWQGADAVQQCVSFTTGLLCTAQLRHSADALEPTSPITTLDREREMEPFWHPTTPDRERELEPFWHPIAPNRERELEPTTPDREREMEPLWHPTTPDRERELEPFWHPTALDREREVAPAPASDCWSQELQPNAGRPNIERPPSEKTQNTPSIGAAGPCCFRYEHAWAVHTRCITGIQMALTGSPH